MSDCNFNEVTSEVFSDFYCNSLLKTACLIDKINKQNTLMLHPAYSQNMNLCLLHIYRLPSAAKQDMKNLRF